MIAVRGRIQREGEVVHLVARKLADLSGDLASVGARDAAFPLPHGRSDQVTHAGGGPDPRELPPKGCARGISISPTSTSTRSK
jgi:error-prone DNA polymerase